MKPWVIAKYGGRTNTQRGRILVDVEYTSMTALAYYGKGQQSETLQLSQHKDCVFSPTGDFLHKNNTHEKSLSNRWLEESWPASRIDFHRVCRFEFGREPPGSIAKCMFFRFRKFRASYNCGFPV